MSLVELPEITSKSIATLLEIISDGVWDWNAETGYVYRSPGWYTMLDYDIDSLDNSVLTWESLIHPDDYPRVMEHFEQYITGKSDTYNIQYRCKQQSGDYLWIEDRASVVKWHADGTVARMIGAHRNINAEKLLYEQSQKLNRSLQEIVDARTEELTELTVKLAAKAQEAAKLARTDALTNLANRYYFEFRLKSEAARAVRFKEPLSLLVFDLDNFKEVNDLQGHASGDEVLKQVAGVVSQHIREIDVVARWGGDEFVVLLPNTTIDKAKLLAEKLRKLIAQTMHDAGQKVTASFGVAQLKKSEDPLRLTIRADHALYTAKNNGRNTISTEQ